MVLHALTLQVHVRVRCSLKLMAVVPVEPGPGVRLVLHARCADVALCAPVRTLRVCSRHGHGTAVARAQAWARLQLSWRASGRCVGGGACTGPGAVPWAGCRCAAVCHALPVPGRTSTALSDRACRLCLPML